MSDHTTEKSPKGSASILERLVMCFVLLFCAVSLSACNEIPKARGEARIALFEKCMEAASKIPRQADDDVSDIVSECSSQSYYMTNWIE